MRLSLPSTRSLCLYGRQSEGDRQAVFETCTDAIKIIYSTDIAEEAITLTDVTHVVNSLRKMSQTEAHGFAGWKTGAISQMSAENRCGRAGRVQNGTCWRI